MPVYISLLRGINVGGNKKIKMADLRDLYALLGFENTKTLLQSGNAVFQTDISDRATVQKTIENGIQERFRFEVQVNLRTPEELKTIIANHPFSDEQVNDPGKISFVFMDRVPDDEAVANLRDSNPGREEIHARGQALYIFYIDGKGRSKLNNNRIERVLNVTATARNWNTTQKLHNLAQDFNG